ncbi:MAG: NUDIX hydrolase [Acidimicrobiia bacterium]
MIEAAGGLVWRRTPKGALRVLLVHRPRYDDWSLPKGKLEAGERHRDAALREVAEETGLRCAVGEELGEVRYRDRKGRAKRVRYWTMEPIGRGRLRPADGDEVDEVRWSSVPRALATLSYGHDADLVRQLAQHLDARRG